MVDGEDEDITLIEPFSLDAASILNQTPATPRRDGQLQVGVFGHSHRVGHSHLTEIDTVANTTGTSDSAHAV